MLNIFIIGKKITVSGEQLDLVRDCLQDGLVHCLQSQAETAESPIETRLFADAEGFGHAGELFVQLSDSRTINCAAPEQMSRAIGRLLAEQMGLLPQDRVVVLEALGREVYLHVNIMAGRNQQPPQKLGLDGPEKERNFIAAKLELEVGRYLSSADPELLKAEREALGKALPRVQEGLRNGVDKFEIQFPTKKALVSGQLLKDYLAWQLDFVSQVAALIKNQPDGTQVVLLGEVFKVLEDQPERFSGPKMGHRRLLKQFLNMSHQELCDQLTQVGLQPSKASNDQGVASPLEKIDSPPPPENPQARELIEALKARPPQTQWIAEGIGRRLIRVRDRHYIVPPEPAMQPNGLPAVDLSSEQARWARMVPLALPPGAFPLAYHLLDSYAMLEEIVLEEGEWVSLLHCVWELDRSKVSPKLRNLFADAVSDGLLRLLAALYHPEVQAWLGATGSLIGFPTLQAGAVLLRLPDGGQAFWNVRHPELRVWTLGVQSSELRQAGMQAYLDWWTAQQPGLPLPSHWRDFNTWDIRMDARAILTIVLALAGPENADVAINARLYRLLRLSKEGRVGYDAVSRIAHPGYIDRLRNTLMELLGAKNIEINP